ncbi:PTS sugar transporter subunit IIB [Culicoidibacter larvae]|uniref:PTS sugar transporter subunit IIB n=1 Tax=Culicoidibacter larvae TaxID=2579976 RepID=A0A5R8QG56_9FIRM|nr:PTS sugar transporter subunit IIB [Culicoidibacter larvae]TLG76764.1 PTS sugar transporter subunit IIB [Culicoidibacter larvae]
MLRIVIMCGGGFSSSHLAARTSKELIQLNMDNEVQIDYYEHGTNKTKFADYDIVMCCPHLKMVIPTLIQETGLAERVPFYIIPPKMYGMISAKELVADAYEVVRRFKEQPLNPFSFPDEPNPLRITRHLAYVHTHK